MSDLVDSSLQERSALQRWMRRLLMAAFMFAFVGLVAWAGLNLSRGSGGPARQVAKITLLPDTPPPPPPPPPEKPKIEPKNEIKQQIDKPKMVTPPEPEQIKMAGQAGEGPSPFAAGEVKNDYIGGDIGNGSRYAAYVDRVAQLIQSELTKRKVRIADARVYLWLSSDGAVQRYQVDGAGSGEFERELRMAMSDLGRLPEAPPQDMPMPLGLEISGR
jgi:periplasmic protein TonB